MIIYSGKFGFHYVIQWVSKRARLLANARQTRVVICYQSNKGDKCLLWLSTCLLQERAMRTFCGSLRQSCVWREFYIIHSYYIKWIPVRVMTIFKTDLLTSSSIHFPKKCHKTLKRNYSKILFLQMPLQQFLISIIERKIALINLFWDGSDIFFNKIISNPKSNILPKSMDSSFLLYKPFPNEV